jgi:hypothetical protein
MFRAASIALLGAALIGGTASAQVGLPGSPPPSGSNPTQDGAYARVGATPAGTPAALVDGGQQAPVGNTVVSPEGPAPHSHNSVEVYARLPKNEAGAPQGADVRVTGPQINGGSQAYQGVQILGQ